MLATNAALVDPIMNLHWLRERLSELHFSAELPAAALDRVAEIGELRECRAGETLFREGIEGRDFYVVITGQLVLSMHVPGRSDVQILSLGPGDPVAWSALIGSGRMTTGAVATADARLISISAERLANLCEQDPEFGYHWMRAVAVALSKRLVATRMQLLELVTETASPVQND